MPGTIGCVEGYTVIVAAKDGKVLGDLTASGNSVDQLSWGRRLDDISEASVTISYGGPDCCGVIGQIQVLHHWIHLFRDGRFVWAGPIVGIVGGRDSITLEARDVLFLLTRRLLNVPLCFSPECAPTAPGVNEDLATIGKTIVDVGMVLDPQGYSVQSEPTGLIGGLRLFPKDTFAWTALQEAMQIGLDVTAIGPKIVMGTANGSKPFGRTASLTCDDFPAGLQYQQDGLSVATRVMVEGDQGSLGLANAPTTNADGTSDYYGHLDGVVSRDDISTDADANIIASQIVASTFPPAFSLVVPDGSSLSPNAPVDINDLIPGVMTTILAADCFCHDVGADLVLATLDVTYNSTDGEQVAVTYVGLNQLNQTASTSSLFTN